MRVRKALLMAIDRWGGSVALAKISTLRSVGGVIRPGSPYATPEAELVKLPGFSKNIAASRGRIIYFVDVQFQADPAACDEGRLPWDFAGADIWDVVKG